MPSLLRMLAKENVDKIEEYTIAGTVARKRGFREQVPTAIPTRIQKGVQEAEWTHTCRRARLFSIAAHVLGEDKGRGIALLCTPINLVFCRTKGFWQFLTRCRTLFWT